MAVILGIYGNRWAWRNSNCISEHEFRQNQRSWTKWAVVTTATLAVFSFFVLYYIAASLKSVEAKAVRDAKRVSDVNVVVAALSRYQYDHSGSCPLQLTELSPKYLEEILEPLQAQSYDLRQEDGRCIISVELESRDNLELGEDYIKGNGAIYDRATEDLENLIFYNE